VTQVVLDFGILASAIDYSEHIILLDIPYRTLGDVLQTTVLGLLLSLL
jgi:hypothetical protein